MTCKSILAALLATTHRLFDICVKDLLVFNETKSKTVLTQFLINVLTQLLYKLVVI